MRYHSSSYLAATVGPGLHWEQTRHYVTRSVDIDLAAVADFALALNMHSLH